MAPRTAKRQRKEAINERNITTDQICINAQFGTDCAIIGIARARPGMRRRPAGVSLDSIVSELCAIAAMNLQS